MQRRDFKTSRRILPKFSEIRVFLGTIRNSPPLVEYGNFDEHFNLIYQILKLMGTK